MHNMEANLKYLAWLDLFASIAFSDPIPIVMKTP